VAAVPGVDDAPLYLARQDGLFARAGLDVRIQAYPSVQAVIAALRGGKAAIGVGDYAGFFYAQETGSGPLTVLADGYDAGPNVVDVLVRPGSGITSAQQLTGKAIGSPSLLPSARAAGDAPYSIETGGGHPYGVETVAAVSTLLDDGVQPTAVTWRAMPPTSLVSALRHRRVSAILASEPQILQAESQLGATSIADVCTGPTAGLPLDGYFARSSYARAHAELLRAFRSALEKAQAMAVRPAPVRAALARYAGLTKPAASLVTLGVYPTSLSVADLQRVADLMFSVYRVPQIYYGALPRPLSVAQMIFK
jgi:NitT/TauT family transport system substrate-binding protein